MQEVNLFGVSQYGKSKNVTAQSRLNAYLEVQPNDDDSRVAHYGTAGLDLFTSFGETPIRGMHQRGDLFYVVHRGTLYSVNNAAVKTVLGTINTTSGSVYMADNGFQLMLTDGIEGWIYTFDNPSPQTITSITHVGAVATVTTAEPHGLKDGAGVVHSGAVENEYNGAFMATVTGVYTYTYTMLSIPTADASTVGTYTSPAFAQILDEGFPRATGVTWQDGYFVISSGISNQFNISAIENGYKWDALDFASAESDPDNLILPATDNSVLHLFGEVSTEFWVNTGNIDFPFSRVSGGSMEWGLAARNSVVKYDNSLAFLAKNKMGEVIVVRMEGSLPKRISTPEIEHRINNYLDVADASFLSYMLGGHPMLQCNFSTGGESWLYDGLSNVWSQLKSHNVSRHRGNLAINYLNKTMVADYENGNVYRLNPNSYTDNGDPIAFELISRHISKNNKRLIVDAVELDLEYGVGLVDGQGSNPQIMMAISKDGGHTFGNERWVSFGKIGQYKYRAIWRRCGQARDFVFKFRITDPVKRVVHGATVKVREGVS